jgi:adenylate kinase family enzyme
MMIGGGGSLVVELLGPAGSGKTTLAQALIKDHRQIRAGDYLHTRNAAHVPFFARHAVLLLPVFLGQWRRGRWFTWDEIKMLVYLKGWHRTLRRQALDQGTVTLLDHGPVFRLTRLYAFGPENIRSQRFERWWDQMCAQWAATLDIVVWLDAPDAVLLERINARDRWHIVKGKPEQEAVQFLARYRTSFEHVMSALTANGGPTVLRFDTAQLAVDQITGQVLAALGLTDNAA